MTNTSPSLWDGQKLHFQSRWKIASMDPFHSESSKVKVFNTSSHQHRKSHIKTCGHQRPLYHEPSELRGSFQSWSFLRTVASQCSHWAHVLTGSQKRTRLRSEDGRRGAWRQTHVFVYKLLLVFRLCYWAPWGGLEARSKPGLKSGVNHSQWSSRFGCPNSKSKSSLLKPSVRLWSVFSSAYMRIGKQV